MAVDTTRYRKEISKMSDESLRSEIKRLENVRDLNNARYDRLETMREELERRVFEKEREEHIKRAKKYEKNREEEMTQKRKNDEQVIKASNLHRKYQKQKKHQIFSHVITH